MTVDHELRTNDEQRTAKPVAPSGRETHPQPPTNEPVSRATIVWYSLAGGILFGWFLFGWLVLEQGFVDSVGEAAGSAFALLLLISIVGTVRRSRRN
ncbi:hypothetical protein GCM10027280_16660 [Micromonospora polyrhachis]|uniref:Uncharacterized protein n=1 Tax=Micromonospora polyrhachis TaxID=1282883 RepID=A0A7W7SPK1_9ACTN|nr:hypothetical protein [Micromonospora polyrhachis]MBB4958446.1 hypothetical protein [Micromonospora polyrhachis]